MWRSRSWLSLVSNIWFREAWPKRHSTRGRDPNCTVQWTDWLPHLTSADCRRGLLQAVDICICCLILVPSPTTSYQHLFWDDLNGWMIVHHAQSEITSSLLARQIRHDSYITTCDNAEACERMRPAILPYAVQLLCEECYWHWQRQGLVILRASKE